MSDGLRRFFSDLIKKVEDADEISNAGKDEGGFYRPTRTIVLRNLNLLRDLHDKPRAREMVKTAWESVANDLPPEWLAPPKEERDELRKILEG